MKMSAKGRAFLKREEAVKLRAYRDAVGIWTIGVGHTSAAGPPTVTEGMTITAAEADEILSRDLAKFEAAVSAAVKVPIAQHEFDALVSLCFNIGEARFKRSTTVRRLNAEDRPGAAEAFLWWNKAGGSVLRGLVNRRKRESVLFLKGYDGERKPAPANAPWWIWLIPTALALVGAAAAWAGRI